MVHFIENVHGRQANHLLQAVLADLGEAMYTAGCRALGLTDYSPNYAIRFCVRVLNYCGGVIRM